MNRVGARRLGMKSTAARVTGRPPFSTEAPAARERTVCRLGTSRRPPGSGLTTVSERIAHRPGTGRPAHGNECPPPSGGHELALVEDIGARAHQGRQMRVGVVGAEEQAPARRHGDADPRPRPAGVAAVGSSQSGFGDCGPFESRSVHAPITHHRPPRPHGCSPVAQSQGARRAPEHAERFAIRLRRRGPPAPAHPDPPRTPHIRPGSGRAARRCAHCFLP